MSRLPALSLLAASWLAVPAQAQQASFDCGRASTRMESAICGNAVAGQADFEMARRYRRVLAALSPAAQTTLRTEQRAFIAELTRGCDLGKSASYPECVAARLRDRSSALANSLTVAGDHRFVRVSEAREKQLRAAEPRSGLGQRFSFVRTSIQIDRPNPAEARWNAAVQRWLAQGVAAAMPGGFARADEPASIEVSLEIVAASRDLIAARRDTSIYAGGPHGSYQSATLLWSLKLGRALRNDEVFANLRDPKLISLVSRNYDAASEKGHQGCDEPDLMRSKLLVDSVGPFFSWDPYETGSYLCGGESRLRWQAAAPHLRRPLSFDPGGLAAPASLISPPR